MKSIAFCRSLRIVLAGTTLLASVAFSGVVHAKFITPQLAETPIDRLTANLGKQVEANPKDLTLRLNLARTHAMAYALKVDTTKVWVGRESGGAWFGYTPAHVPFKAKPTDEPEKLKAAKAQLQTAIQRYQEILKLEPKHLAARLGYAWCLDQAGQDMRAVDEYRKTIELGWKKEKDMTRPGVGWHSVVKEAAGYLIPLLDKKADADEIARLVERSKHVSRFRRPITPIAVPLRAGLTIDDVQDREACVAFDADGSGYTKTWTWISHNAAWLVYDHRSTGRITSALQMFGNVTFWLFWDHGYQAVASLDNNRDGRLSGAELRGLALWHDANGNGVSEVGEVRSLQSVGIKSLSCQHVYKGTGVDQFAYSPDGVTFVDGTQRPTYDVILHPSPQE